MSDRLTLETRRPEASSPPQEKVTRFFDGAAGFWTQVYSAPGVFADTHRRRLELALAWIDSLGLQPGAHILVVGAGAGFEVIGLANRGYALTAIEPASTMVGIARGRADAAGCTGVRWVNGDAHALGFARESFDVVMALGVIPWLHTPGVAMAEMGRVLRPGGWWLGSADNAVRLDRLVDPARNPVVAPLSRRIRKAVMRPSASARPKARMHTGRAVHRLLDDAGIDPVAEVTFGFGPFTLIGRSMLPEAVGRTVNAKLTELALRGVPLARATGSQRLALGQKRLVTP